jgi:hypothetical protein
MRASSVIAAMIAGVDESNHDTRKRAIEVNIRETRR